MSSTDTDRISAQDLDERWQAVCGLQEGEAIESVPICNMPHWDDICSQLDWRMHLLDNRHFTAKYHGRCGVYRIVLLENEGDLSRTAALNRAFGRDPSGTLYIGESKFLNERLNQIQRSLKFRREESHSAISTMRSVPILRKLSSKLAVALKFTGAATRAIELDLIRAYLNSYGDTPPLNSRV